MKPKHINIKQLAKGLEKLFPEIFFAFLFGSSREGTINPGSDVDLAIYIQETKDKFTLISRILEMMESEISTDNFDLVILNDADPVLAMDIYADFYSLTCR